MATLSVEDRQKIWRGLMRLWSGDREAVDVSKTDLQSIINATDDWIDGNQSNYLAYLPAAASSLSGAQKTLIFCAVALARVGIAALRCVFGEVNGG